MDTPFDTEKNRTNEIKHDLPLEGFEAIFDGFVHTEEDRQRNYPEQRLTTWGMLNGDVVRLTWTPVEDENGDEYPRAISLRHAEPAEVRTYVKRYQTRR